MPQLISPTWRLYAAWQEAHDEWGPGLHEDGFGLLPTDDVRSTEGFSTWLDRLSSDSDRCFYRWIVEGEQILGGIALRLGNCDFNQRHGHVGYGIRPSARGRGLAGWALERMATQARALGMKRVLIVCEVDNLASAKTIESQGGLLEDGPGSVRRYWIDLAMPPSS
ncbi:GNAT family N-acetyltransferase [Arthrobacter tecti]